MVLALAKFACAFCALAVALWKFASACSVAALARPTRAALFAVVEAGQHRALGDAVADIGAQFDQHAGNLEADLGCDAGLDGAEAEDFDRHIALDGADLHVDRTQIERPRAE